jgi:uncharacterized protein YidB (DUF937 family)
MDVLTGMSNGPRGGLGGGFGGGGFGGGGHSGMSPIVMAALGLLAYKAVKGMGAAHQPTAQPTAMQPQTAPTGGALGSILGSLGLGGAASAGTGLGGILSGGLGDLVRQFQAAGHGDTANSWVASGENKPIAPLDLERVLTPEQIDFLTQKTGMSRSELLNGLSQQLPEVVDRLTPQGRIPAPHEMEQV